MSNKTPSQQRHFDYLYELYHFNPFHDKMGRFASRGGSYRGYVNSNGTLTDKARRRLNIDNGSGKQSGNGGGNNNNNNSNNDNNKDNGKKIRVDSSGRVHRDDQNEAIKQIEQNISKDFSNKSKAFNDTSKFANDSARTLGQFRDRAAKAKAAKEDISTMSNDELKRYIDERKTRMNLERQYRELKEEDYKRGKHDVDEMLATAGSVLALAATAASIAATIHTIRS